MSGTKPSGLHSKELKAADGETTSIELHFSMELREHVWHFLKVVTHKVTPTMLHRPTKKWFQHPTSQEFRKDHGLEPQRGPLLTPPSDNFRKAFCCTWGFPELAFLGRTAVFHHVATCQLLQVSACVGCFPRAKSRRLHIPRSQLPFEPLVLCLTPHWTQLDLKLWWIVTSENPIDGARIRNSTSSAIRISRMPCWASSHNQNRLVSDRKNSSFEQIPRIQGPFNPNHLKVMFFLGKPCQFYELKPPSWMATLSNLAKTPA